MSEKLIPLYCLTGFVGSGKTTALLSILKQNPGKKIGVIFTEPSIFKSHDLMNEEDISIEHLENGSLQCSCSEDAIVRALHFMQQCQPEMVFIEVAGLSDPIHIKHILEQERTAPNSTLLTEHYEMQGIICLVDADNFMEQIQDVEMIRLQLCHCHLAVINKADLVSPELLTAIKAQIRRINPDCDISSCSYGGFSLELLENDLLSHSTDEGEQDLPAELRPDSIVLNCIHRLPREMDSFEDPRIYVAGEFGIGLNTLSQCLGNCYIEDESTFSTFHIGMGRNLALGGIQDAAGHFDLVFHRPTIYADQTLIMENGIPVV